jgi:hypothetical protein
VDVPKRPERSDQSQAALRLPGRFEPAERRSQVAKLGRQRRTERPPQRLVVGAFGQEQHVVGVDQAGRTLLPALDQELERELAHRLQHLVARLIAPFLFRRQQARPDQRGDALEHRDPAIFRDFAHRRRPGQREAPDEDG